MLRTEIQTLIPLLAFCSMQPLSRTDYILMKFNKFPFIQFFYNINLMGPFVSICGGLKKQRGKIVKKDGGKKGVLEFDLNVGFTVVQDQEFKDATRRLHQKKNEEEEISNELKKMQDEDIEKELDIGFKQIWTAVTRDKKAQQTLQMRRQKYEHSLNSGEVMLLTMQEKSKQHHHNRIVAHSHHHEQEDQKHFNRYYKISFVNNDELLERMLSFSTKSLLQEKKCEPSPFFPLKNSDELLWEDQTEYLSNVTLLELTRIIQFKEHLEVVWEGLDSTNPQKMYQIVINNLSTTNYFQIHAFEDEFFHNKRLQQKLIVTRQEAIGQEFYQYIYHLQLFRIQYGNVYLNVRESRSMTLRRMIEIRKNTNQKYTDFEILSIMLSLLKAIRDAGNINITHGGINDENVYFGWGGRVKIGDFGQVRLKKKIFPQNLFQESPKQNLQAGMVGLDPKQLQTQDYIENLKKQKQQNQTIELSEQQGFGQTGELGENDISVEIDEETQLKTKIDEITKNYLYSYEFQRYHAYKYEPRHTMFIAHELQPAFKRSLSEYYLGEYHETSKYHEKETYKFRGTDDELRISEMLKQNDIYSVGIIGLLLVTLGGFEDMCRTNDKDKKQSTEEQNSKAEYYQSIHLSLCRSIYGQPFKMIPEYMEMMVEENIQKQKLLDKIQRPDEKTLEQLFDKYIIDYPQSISYIKQMITLNPSQRYELKSLVKAMQDEKSMAPQDDIIYREYKRQFPQAFPSHIDQVLVTEKQTINQQILKAFQKEFENARGRDKDQKKEGTDKTISPDQSQNLIQKSKVEDLKETENFYELVRKIYYKSLGYMLIRNYRLCLLTISKMEGSFKKAVDHETQNKLRYFSLNDFREVFFSNFEVIQILLFKGICQLECRNIVQANETFIEIEGALINSDIETIKVIKQLVPKFYQGLVAYYEGEAEKSLILFNRVIDLSKGELRNQDLRAYYQLSKIMILLHLDTDGYFEAFKLLDEIIQFQSTILYKYDDYITVDLVQAHYFQGKAYFEVSQYELSRVEFVKAFDLMKSQKNISTELISLRLRILGYISYLLFKLNDMESMSVALTESVSILNALLKREHYLETVIIWLNSFGFLLKAHFNQNKEELHQFIEVFDLIIIKNEKHLNIDIFFKNYVFAKLYYFADQLKKSQKTFLDTLEMHQYYITDDLKVKQTQNVSLKQLKLLQDQKVVKLNEFKTLQKKGGPNLPPPEKDNLTIRIIVEIYDWLGYIYSLSGDHKRSQRCHDLHEEFATNLILFDKTLNDEYMLRIAQIKFQQKKFEECLEILRNLSVDLKKQQIDDYLKFEYQWIQSEIQQWMGTLYLILKSDELATKSYLTAKAELFQLQKCSELLYDEMENMYDKQEDLQNQISLNDLKDKQNTQETAQKLQTEEPEKKDVEMTKNDPKEKTDKAEIVEATQKIKTDGLKKDTEENEDINDYENQYGQANAQVFKVEFFETQNSQDSDADDEFKSERTDGSSKLRSNFTEKKKSASKQNKKEDKKKKKKEKKERKKKMSEGERRQREEKRKNRRERKKREKERKEQHGLNGEKKNQYILEQIQYEEMKKICIQNEKNHQIVVLILFIQLFMKIAGDCLALGLRKKALDYMEQLIKDIEQDYFFNSPLFVGYIKQSLKIDLFFFMGYLYGMNEQHENAFVFYDRTHYLLNQLYEMNSLDQTNIEHMSLIYDQLGRVSANQGFYTRASKYLYTSLQMLQRVKREASEVQLAYKFANIGAIELRKGGFQAAEKSLHEASKLFQLEYGVNSMTVFAARAKIIEVKLNQSNIRDISLRLLTLLKEYKELPPDIKSLRLTGQIARLRGSHFHKLGEYSKAYEFYLKAFVLMLDDAEVGDYILDQMAQGFYNNVDFLNIKITDRASIEVCMSIAELYLDNNQVYEAFKMATSLLDIFRGVAFTPQTLHKLRVLGIDSDNPVQISRGSSILVTVPCLAKEIIAYQKKGTSQKPQMSTYYQERGLALMRELRNRKSANILSLADSFRVKVQCLNTWYIKHREPYLYSNYEDLIQHFNHMKFAIEQGQYRQRDQNHKNKGPSKKDYKPTDIGRLYDDDDPKDRDFILKEQRDAKVTIMDALIIYSETIGDFHLVFAKALFLLAERQYFMFEGDQVDIYMQKIISLISNITDAALQVADDPILYWKALILQAKVKMQNNRFGKFVLFLLGKVYVDEALLSKIISLIRQNNDNFIAFVKSWMNDDEINFIDNQKRFHQIIQKFDEDQSFSYTSHVDLPLFLFRDMLEAQNILRRVQEYIQLKEEKYRRLKQKDRSQMDKSLPTNPVSVTDKSQTLIDDSKQEKNQQFVPDKIYKQVQQISPILMEQTKFLLELTDKIIQKTESQRTDKKTT